MTQAKFHLRYLPFAALALVLGSAVLGQAMVPPAPVAAPRGSMMALMVETVAPAAAAIWENSYADNLTEEHWTKLKSAAAALAETAAIVRAGGTLPADQAKASVRAWNKWATNYSDLTAALGQAAGAKDQKALVAAADTMVEICGGCHMAFPAAIP